MVSSLMREVKAGCLEITAENLEELSDDSGLMREEIIANRQRAMALRLQAYSLRNSYTPYLKRIK